MISLKLIGYLLNYLYFVIKIPLLDIKYIFDKKELKNQIFFSIPYSYHMTRLKVGLVLNYRLPSQC